MESLAMMGAKLRKTEMRKVEDLVRQLRERHHL